MEDVINVLLMKDMILFFKIANLDVEMIKSTSMENVSARMATI